MYRDRITTEFGVALVVCAILAVNGVAAQGLPSLPTKAAVSTPTYVERAPVHGEVIVQVTDQDLHYGPCPLLVVDGAVAWYDFATPPATQTMVLNCNHIFKDGFEEREQ